MTTAELPRDALLREVSNLRWFHTIDLGDGVVTPGADETPRKAKSVHLPPDLRGRSVLDVGAWDGYFSFEAERRGAARVVAIDPNAWRAQPGPGNPWSGKLGFELARRALGSRVEDVDIDLAELSPERVGRFDVVLFLGVFYHLPDPLPILERVASVSSGTLILETHADLLMLRRPAMAYYPSEGLDDDSSNWWGPNRALLEALLKSHGFSTVTTVHSDAVAYRVARSAARRLRRKPYLVQQGRVVVHASR